MEPNVESLDHIIRERRIVLLTDKALRHLQAKDTPRRRARVERLLRVLDRDYPISRR